MLNANRLVRRHKIPIFSTNEEDRPLIVQVRARDAMGAQFRAPVDEDAT